MTTDQFAYWLQGFSELNDGPPTAKQWQSIRDHLALVFTKVTPSYPPLGIAKGGPGGALSVSPQLGAAALF